MSYIKTKISNSDKEILREIFDGLNKITLPTSYCSKGIQGIHHAVKTGTTSQRGARQAVFGLVKYRGVKQTSKFLEKYPHIMDLFKKFINNHYPNFDFNGVYVNKNTVCKKHLDSKNVGESLLVGFGPFTGGESVLYINDKEHNVNINTNSLIFNGSEIPHKSLPFEGTRFSLVFFK